jgi:hypothetical protein
VRRVRAGLTVAAVALAVAACAEQASAQAVVIDTPGGPRIENAVGASLKVTGALTVDFHGDPATCASAGLCGVSGTVSWDVAGPGTLIAIGYRDQGQLAEQAILALGAERGPQAAAQVRRDPQGAGAGGICTDAGESQFTLLFLGTRPEPSVEVGITPSAEEG